MKSPGPPHGRRRISSWAILRSSEGSGDRGKRAVLGGGAFEALAKAYRELPEACDFVMYWWHNAANLVREARPAASGSSPRNSLGRSSTVGSLPCI